MDVSKLSDQEKSVMLARAMGWTIEHNEVGEDPHTGRNYYSSWISDDAGRPIDWPCDDGTVEWSIPAFRPSWREFTFNLYDSANMPLAWRVLNWFTGEDREIDKESIKKLPAFLAFDSWWTAKDNFLYQLSPVDAQRAWLDKILELAIDAGLVPAKEAV